MSGDIPISPFDKRNRSLVLVWAEPRSDVQCSLLGIISFALVFLTIA